MKTNEILDQLFFINDELKFNEVDSHFEKLGFHNNTREKTILSFIGNDHDEISSFVLNIAERKILNSNFKTFQEINLEAIQDYAREKYNFSYEQEVDNLIIYQRDDLRLHIRTINFPESEFSKVMYQISLFVPLSSDEGEVSILPPPAIQ